jgi:transcription initiation factor TFIIH subunit 2
MGFPPRSSEDPATAVFVGKECILRPGSYTCPRCASRSAELPTQCHVCGLSLISSAQLARSYHHLFPVRPFEEVAAEALEGLVGCSASADVRELWWEGEPQAGQAQGLYCFGCLRGLGRGRGGMQADMVLCCPNCKQLFCLDCDTYVHESLHNCPGCECRQVVPDVLE